MVSILFNLLFFLTPIVFLPFTSELFEFNKMILVYIFTILIVSAWGFKMLKAKKFIFKRTLLDFPLLLFLGSQLVATFFSIDVFTSIFGYYSRFNGGLLSIICYSLLYWAFVSNMDSTKTRKLFKTILISAFLVSIYAFLEHFGHSISCLIITKDFGVDCWVQDVQNRVFATLGQPNWLAAWITALVSLTWVGIIFSKFKNRDNRSETYYHILNALFFVTLLFTKSRSGIIAFAVSYTIFWGFLLFREKRKFLNVFILSTLYLTLCAVFIGTPWTPSLTQTSQVQTAKVEGPALETGGTESGTLRKIVWQGALQVWKHNFFLGSGPETFAYSYYNFRPAEHNLTSEWDFLYNKAHNEFLNMAANSGSIGLLTYIFLILSVLLTISNFNFQRNKAKNTKANTLEKHFEINLIKTALFGGFTSLLVTNFFGFSVVVTNLEFFLFPAFAIALQFEEKKTATEHKLSNLKVTTLLLFTLFLLYLVGRYWYADTLFAKGRSLNGSLNALEATKYLTEATQINPLPATYHDELSQSYTQLAIAFLGERQATHAATLASEAKKESDLAQTLSPKNVNLLKSRANIFTDLSEINPNYLMQTLQTLQTLLVLAPTDASIYHRLGLALATNGQTQDAKAYFEKAIELKSDYKNARLALSYLYRNEGEKDKAKEQLEYILEHIAPSDEFTISELEKLD